MQNISELLANKHLAKNVRIQDLGSKNKTPKLLKIQDTADYLSSKFESPDFRPFFLKVAWRLDRNTIDRLMATAFELGTNPRAYFIALVKQDERYSRLAAR